MEVLVEAEGDAVEDPALLYKLALVEDLVAEEAVWAGPVVLVEVLCKEMLHLQYYTQTRRLRWNKCE